MERLRVTSSMINSVGYDPTELILEVEFLNGRIYQYLDVSLELYESLMSSSSLGKSFNSLLKNQGFEHRQV
jgi:hypothetical protein